MNRKIATTMKYLKTRYTPEELSWMNREHVGDRTGYLRRWYESMTIPVPDDDALIPDFNYKIRPQDVHVTKQYNKVDRTIDDIIAKMNRDSEPPINLSYYTTKVPDIIDHNAIAHSLINSRREQTEDNRMDETALLNLGFTQQEITDLFGKAHTLDNIGISSNLQQNLDKINALNKFNAKLNVIEPGNTINNIKNVYNATKEPTLKTDDGVIDSGDESDNTYDSDESEVRSKDKIRSKLDTSIDSSKDSGWATLDDRGSITTDVSDDITPSGSRYGTPEIDETDKVEKYENIFTKEFEPIFKSGRTKADRYKVKHAVPHLLQIVQDLKKNKDYGIYEKMNTESIKKLYMEIVEMSVDNRQADSALNRITEYYRELLQKE